LGLCVVGRKKSCSEGGAECRPNVQKKQRPESSAEEEQEEEGSGAGHLLATWWQGAHLRQQKLGQAHKKAQQ